MKKYVRWIALVLSVLVFCVQLAGCSSESEYEKYNNVVSMENLNQAVAEQLTEETKAVIDWLQEHLENIRQSLLNGEYSRVVSELLEQWSELKNQEYYNALLYIAYMGNGDKAEATTLLENDQLNMDAFVDAVEETAEELKENPDIQKIVDDLMETLNGPEETTRPAAAYVPPATTEPEEIPEERPTQPRETEPPETVPEETVPEESECPPLERVDRGEDELEPTETCPPPPVIEDRDNHGVEPQEP